MSFQPYELDLLKSVIDDYSNLFKSQPMQRISSKGNPGQTDDLDSSTNRRQELIEYLTRRIDEEIQDAKEGGDRA